MLCKKAAEEGLWSDLNHHVIRRIENGERFVTDIELLLLADVLQVSIVDLLAKPE